MKININAIEIAIDIQKYMIIQEIEQATIKDDHLQQLRQHIIMGWAERKN